MALTFGSVPHPPFVDRLIPDNQNSAWDDLGSRRPVGVCQHSMEGTLWGTDAFFRLGPFSAGLTDYGIGGATDGAEWDGVIFRWNDPRGHGHQQVLIGVAQRHRSYPVDAIAAALAQPKASRIGAHDPMNAQNLIWLALLSLCGQG
jgi:hypothetical protein